MKFHLNDGSVVPRFRIDEIEDRLSTETQRNTRTKTAMDEIALLRELKKGLTVQMNMTGSKNSQRFP